MHRVDALPSLKFIVSAVRCSGSATVGAIVLRIGLGGKSQDVRLGGRGFSVLAKHLTDVITQGHQRAAGQQCGDATDQGFLIIGEGLKYFHPLSP